MKKVLIRSVTERFPSCEKETEVRREEKSNWISTLRGAAILLVFCSHLESGGRGDGFKFIIGRIGVVIFFMLAGYLAVPSREKRSKNQYIFNRLVRMYPVYWVILILTFVVTNVFSTGKEISVFTLAGNMTLFNQFIGIPDIIGASWMMPIQVSFFILIGLFGVNIFTKKVKCKFGLIDMKIITQFGLMVMAVMVGYLRHRTGVLLPTAFFLLMAAAFLGVDFYNEIIQGGGYTSTLIFSF